MKNRSLIILSALIIILFVGMFLLPVIEFNDDYSTVIVSEDASLIGAKIASDEQWRFPLSASLSSKFKTALIQYEDKRFEWHRGIDVLRLFKAIQTNLKNRKITSGASTISMQLARIWRKNPERNLGNKMYEIVLALKLELLSSKNNIFNMYAAHAPFGGNVVGVETASWRYFGKGSVDLSWAEASTLAVLPNSPGLIHPGRNRDKLKSKRDNLLFRLFAAGRIDSITLELALLEALPEEPVELPQKSVHLLDYFDRFAKEDQQVQTSIDLELQNKVAAILKNYYQSYKQNGIRNMAVLVIENQTGEVLAYHGNIGSGKNDNEAFYVDMIRAGRSSGSILKPVLFALSLDEGLITTETILPDIPGSISGYRPKNFNRGYGGAVNASKALQRSLNIPFVYLLQRYTINKLLHQLKALGFTSINESADHYGLPLILGGANVSLWDLCLVYSRLANKLNNYNEHGNEFTSPQMVWPILRIEEANTTQSNLTPSSPDISPGAIWLTFEVMSELERPDLSGNWEKFSGSQKIAWKTGTSYGFKDAWSIGTSREYTVGVWVGNASGEGRPGLTGIKAAAPILFSVFGILPVSEWFDEPVDDLKSVRVCSQSGFPATAECENQKDILVPYKWNPREMCPYHHVVQVDESQNWTLSDGCEFAGSIKMKSYFILPPLMEYYYKNSDPFYESPPPVHPNCIRNASMDNPMELIYPTNPTRINIPVESTGQKGRVVFRIAHRYPKKKIFWYINDHLISTTTEFHGIEFEKEAGTYVLTALDEDGYQLKQNFVVVE